MPKVCCEANSYPLIKIEENKSVVIFQNPKREEFESCVVDGCLIDDGIRCDHLLRRPGVLTVLIELKGGDIDHAKKQLIATLESKHVHSKLEKNLATVVICSKVRVPAATAYFLKAKQEMMRKFKARFVVKSSPATFCPFEICGVVK